MCIGGNNADCMVLFHRSVLPNCSQSCSADLDGACTNFVNDQQVILNSDAQFAIGSFYAPDAHIQATPNANGTTTALFIGNTITFNNNASFDVLYDGSAFVEKAVE